MPCAGCPCPESKRNLEHFEYQRLLQFLTGLNETYTQARNQIMMIHPTPSLNKAYSLIIYQESQRRIANLTQIVQTSEHLEGATLYSNNGAGYTGDNLESKKNQLQCEYCHYKDQTKENCFKLIGYPPDFKSKRKGSNLGSYANYTCNFDANSTTGNYVSKPAPPPPLQPQRQGRNAPISVGTSMAQPSASFFTQEQYQQIIQLLSKGCNEGSSEKSATVAGTMKALFTSCINKEWIVDTGATDHMKSTLEVLKTFKQKLMFERSKVHLPTGDVAYVSHIGKASVFEGQNISNVLYIPEFKYNLLSVSKLTKELQCSALFFPDFCIFQDLCSGQVKAIGKEDRGLYVLTKNFAQQGSALIGIKSAENNSVVLLAIIFLLLVYFGIEGIDHQSTCVYIPQQNDIVERRHRTILDVARSLRFQASIPLRFWGEYVNTVVYLLKRLPSKVIEYKSPFQKLYLHPPSLNHLRVFGYLSYATSHNIHDKFSSRAIPSVLMGEILVPEEAQEQLPDLLGVPGNSEAPDPPPVVYDSTDASETHNLRRSLRHKVVVDPKWIKAMQLEIAALEDNHTWTTIDLPQGKVPIGCKWMFKVKYRASGEVQRYKARLVAKGYSQKRGSGSRKHSPQ
ncbi:PREDICTED: uncharacterized protein LOC109206448 [Nicotiana attenuata]|uniref:uncharacterized protein LOC109206448 n=1 Tax=Nicotiana attenuata TaxID=49451 RepID=UPI0009052204|nr:PREDICTED: uncharacterized protein LOC109206448 [Nicotiana attenuata]